MQNKLKFKNALLITDSDLDGSSCRLLFERFLEDDNYKLYQSTANEVAEFTRRVFSEAYDLVGFADLGPTPEFVSSIVKHKPVHIWDHHPTTKEKIDTLGNPAGLNYNYDVGRCSAKLVFDFFDDPADKNVTPVCREFVRLVDVYDRYLEDHPDFDLARGISNLLFWYIRESRFKGQQGYTRFIDNQSKKMDLWSKFGFLDFEEEVVQKEYQREKEAVEKALNTVVIREDAEGLKYGYFELPSKISYSCSEVLKKMPELNYVVCHSTYKSDGDRCSFRAKKMDVSVKASQYGGGGHKFASGAALPKEIREGIKAGTFIL